MSALPPARIGISRLLSAFAILMLLALTGCFSVYEPPPLSVPLLAKRNEFAVSAGGTRTGVYEGRTYRGNAGVLAKAAYGDVAWAPTDHVRLAASAAYLEGRAAEGAQGRNVQSQLAGGWGASPVPALRVEALGGAGYDHFDVADCTSAVDGRHESCSSWLDVSGRAGRLFAQAHVGLALAPVEVAVGLRNTVMIAAFERVNDEPVDRVAAAPILEPYLVARAGWKWVKLEAQFSVPIVLYSGHEAREPLVRSSGPRLTLGLRFSWMDWSRSLGESFRKQS